ncbi:MAG: hypothetical protein LIO77_01475 [Rikenellaceae bacterium]|nr:hypothetical protein [Rikenellaceae bacterium]
MTEHELDVDHKLQITDEETGNLWEMDMQTGSVAIYDKDGVLIAEKQLNSREMARWLTLDRFAEKYYSHSPYSYAVGNPILYVDINGDSVDLGGPARQAAFDQLNDRLGNELTLTMGENGRISATQIEGVKLSRAGKQALKAFNSADIKVKVWAENRKETSSGELFIGGAFLGNTVTQNADGTTTVVAMQTVNPDVLGSMSNAYGKPGQDILHEVTEAYHGGLISQRSGISSPASNHPGSVYQRAHNRATRQTPAFENIYDNAGNQLQMLPGGVYPSNISRAEWYVKKRGQSTIIQTLP